jgi:hypothetical protein
MYPLPASPPHSPTPSIQEVPPPDPILSNTQPPFPIPSQLLPAYYHLLGPETILSLRTTLAALEAFDDIPMHDVREITRALAHMALDQTEESWRRINSLSEQVQGLGDRLMGYEETFK